MHTYISLLRGINVSGQKKIIMEALRQVYTGLYLLNVRTYLQSGNVLFESEDQDVPGLVRQIEARIVQAFGYSVPVLIREAAYFQRLIAGNPFLHTGDKDPSSLYVTFFYTSPDPTRFSSLAAPGGSDEFAAGEDAVYLYCPEGYGRTKLNNTFFERKITAPATTRNWKTVTALFALALETP